MFQADAFEALGVMTDDLPLEIAMGFLAQESHNVLAAKSGNAVAHQSRIDPGQGSRRFEHDIRSPFTLVGRPIVMGLVGSQHFLMGWIEAAGDPVENRRPGGPQLGIHQGLGFGESFDPGEAVIFPLVAQAGPIHLTGQPFPAVEANLDGEREPALDSGMHEPKDGIDPVMVKKQAFAPTRVEFQFFRLPVTVQFIALTGLHGGQDADQAFFDPISLGDLSGYFFLVDLGGIQVHEGAFLALGLGAGGRFQLVALLLREFTEVFQENSYMPEVVKHSTFNRQNSQSAPQDQTIEAAQMADDIFLVLLYKLFHGVLLGLSLAISTISQERRHFLRQRP